MLEYRGLRSFVAVAEDLHFGRAAERLGVAQSVVSAHLKRIEDTVGARLVNRGQRSSVSLTRAGETFLVEARLAIEQLDRAGRIGHLAGRGEAGPVRLGYVFSAIMCGVTAACLGVLRRRFPETETQALLMETPQQIAAVADGRLDIGLIRPRPSYPPSVTARRIHSEPFVIALPEGHAAAGRRELTPADLAGEHFVAPQFDEAAGFAETLDRLARQGGFDLPPLLRTDDFVTALGVVASGHGAVLAPRSLSRIGLDGVIFRPLASFLETADLVLISRALGPVGVVPVLLEKLGCAA